MSKISAILKSNLVYEFAVVGVVWTVIAIGSGRALVLWPALTCFATAFLLQFLPSRKVTWPWMTSSAVLGFVVAGYQACVAISFISGAFSLVAIETLVGFALFALVHLGLLYSGYSFNSKPAKRATS